MPKKTVKFLVLGCGRQAWLAFFPWIKANPNARLEAVADINEDQARRAAKEFGARKVFTDIEKAIKESDADAAIVVTPPWAHAEPVALAARRGMSVLCEKPMAVNSAECRRMIEECEKNNVLLRIGFSLRFDPGYEKVKTMIKTGDIGRVFQLRAEYDLWAPDLTKSPMREIIQVGGRLRLSHSPDMGAWRVNDARAGGGVFFDHGIHYVDLFRFFMDEDCDVLGGTAHKVVPTRSFEDHASCMLRFESGAAAHIQTSLSRWSARDEIEQGMINGSGGCIRFKFDPSWFLRGYPHLYHTHARVWKFGVPSLILGRWLPEHVPHGPAHVMFKRQIDDFVSRVNGSFEPHPVFGEIWGATGHDGLRAIEIAEQVVSFRIRR
ncbi:MAG TPA: Gfo/Idh/MocA family oxidoreductase [bacterium]|mgnify:CR=1 FL=1|nr:Gfo/Idh/MocA family oxidoreductase [bacterium]